MSYRDRRAARADRLRGWADKRKARAAATLKADDKYRGDHAFNTQPGHIPERARVIARADKAHESIDKADAMERRAAEIERQADNAIYSDDHDACDRLRERIAALEAERARVKEVNKAIRAHGLIRLVQADPPFVLTTAEARELVRTMELCPYHKVESKGWPAYHLQNLGGNITRQRKRLAELEPREAQRARVAEVLEAERAAETTPEQAATIAEVMTVIDAGYTAIAEGRDPVEAVAEAIRTAEAAAAPLAEVPFSLQAPIARPSTKQGGLF